MGSLSKTKVSPALEVEGVWVDWVEGIRLKIAHHNNPKASAFMTKALLGAGKHINSSEHQTDIRREAYGRHVLVGWSGVTDDDGVEIPYSPDQSVAFLKDPELRPLWDFVTTVAVNDAFFRIEPEPPAKN